MERIGITNVARWMIDQLPKGVEAYMDNQGKLYRLKRIRSYSGKTRPVFATLFTGHVGGEFTGMEDCYSLSSLVFLSTDTNLAGTPTADVTNAVEPVNSDCWALQANEWPTMTHNESVGCQQHAAEQSKRATMPWCG